MDKKVYEKVLKPFMEEKTIDLYSRKKEDIDFNSFVPKNAKVDFNFE
jgi:hypothetical protein